MVKLKQRVNGLSHTGYYPKNERILKLFKERANHVTGYDIRDGKQSLQYIPA